MVSSSSSSQAAPTSSSHFARASSRLCKYDVFLSFRGEDLRKTFVDHLYSALVDRKIHSYKDEETLPRGESIRLSLFEAIEESQIAVIIFSKNYANSSWCLEELAHIMKCKEGRGLIVLTIFYDVDPSDVRKQKGDFGKEFIEQEVQNINKAQLWRKALVDASNIAGWEPKHIANGHESEVIKGIVDTILDRLFPLISHVDEDLVGMTTRLEDLKSQLEIGSEHVRMVGIWGVGGSGKTTLATSVYMQICHHFQGHCIVENVREEISKSGLKKLQQIILSTIFKKEVNIHSVEEGAYMIRSMLCRRKVLVLLDDVDKLGQLEALAGKHNWFGSGSRIIITTRDEHLLRTHKVDKICRVKLLTDDEAVRLFNIHAYNEEDPIENYETLSLRVVSYAAGLPLALKVLGSFLYDKDKNEWISALDKLKDIPDIKVMDMLRISYDGLETYEKELFLDIACFWRGKNKHQAMEILEACGFHPEIGIKVLKQKTLITIEDDSFDMHDLLQEMGHYIVRHEHPNNPEQHSRVWKDDEISYMCFRDETKEKENDKIEVISYEGYSYDHSSRFCKIVSNMKKLRCLMVSMEDEEDGGPTNLSNELRCIDWKGYPGNPFPESFQPMKLAVIKLWGSMQKELWRGYKHLPHLKVLQLTSMKKLLSTPDFDGLPCLQKLRLVYCDELEEIHPSLGNHTSLQYLSLNTCGKLKMFPTIIHMKNLKTLQIEDCFLKDGGIPFGIGELSNLQVLNLSWNDFSRLDFSISQLSRLKILNLSGCGQLLELPEPPSSLVILNADYCFSLTTIGDWHTNCKWLCQVSLWGGSIINDGGRLLQSMLEGNAIENDSMLLRIEGLEVAKGFKPPLVRGTKCTLQLPENWGNHFCGFLMCAVFSYDFYWSDSVRISMNQVTSGKDSQHDLVWMESEDNDMRTWVWYFSFGSLRHTAWLDQTNSAVSFNIEDVDEFCSGFGVRLIAKKHRSGLTKTSSDYTPNFKIEHDSVSGLRISLSFNDQ